MLAALAATACALAAGHTTCGFPVQWTVNNTYVDGVTTSLVTSDGKGAYVNGQSGVSVSVDCNNDALMALGGSTRFVQFSFADALHRFRIVRFIARGGIPGCAKRSPSVSAKKRTDHGLQPSPSAISAVFGPVISFPDYEGQLNHTYSITPRLVNNFIGSGNYNDYTYSVADLGAAVKAFPFKFNIQDGGANAGFGLYGLGVSGYPFGRRAGQPQIVDDVSYNVGRHWLKAGVNYRAIRESDLQYSPLVYIPRVTFRNLKDFAGGVLNPSGGRSDVYTQAFTATPTMHLRLYNLGFYLEDQWAVTPSLKVTAALRFERTGNPDCIDHCFSRLVEPFAELSKGSSIPYNQLIQAGLAHAYYDVEPLVPQPRFALAYSPAWLKGTVFRGGMGVFTDLYPAYFAGTMGGNPPNVFTSVLYTGTVNTGGPGTAAALAAASANAFESQFANGATLAQLQQGVSQFGPPGSYASIPSTLRSPKFLEWSFEIDRQIGARNVFIVRYAGNHGYDIFLTNPNVNAYADPTLFPNGFAGLPSAPPDPRFQIVSQLTNNGYSNYHGLTATFRRGLGHGFLGQLNYTWSHALDTLSNGGLTAFNDNPGQINPNNARSLNYSNADYDVRHEVTADFIWDIPVRVKNRWMGTILSGWSAAGRLNTHTGTPFSVGNSDLGARSQLGASIGLSVLADVLDPHIRTTCGSSAVDTPCFTTSQFVSAGVQSDLGNRPRNFFRGPGFFDLDSSVYKTLAFRERMRFTFGASAYNLLNHPNFGIPSSDVNGQGLGQIYSTVASPSSPYGSSAGLSGRTLVLIGRFAF